jgi:hypothetical protein
MPKAAGFPTIDRLRPSARQRNAQNALNPANEPEGLVSHF